MCCAEFTDEKKHPIGQDVVDEINEMWKQNKNQPYSRLAVQPIHDKKKVTPMLDVFTSRDKATVTSEDVKIYKPVNEVWKLKDMEAERFFYGKSMERASDCNQLAKELHGILSEMNKKFPFVVRYYRVDEFRGEGVWYKDFFHNPLPEETKKIETFMIKAIEKFPAESRGPLNEPADLSENMWYVKKTLEDISKKEYYSNFKHIEAALLLLNYLKNSSKESELEKKNRTDQFDRLYRIFGGLKETDVKLKIEKSLVRKIHDVEKFNSLDSDQVRDTYKNKSEWQNYNSIKDVLSEPEEKRLHILADWKDQLRQSRKKRTSEALKEDNQHEGIQEIYDSLMSIFESTKNLQDRFSHIFVIKSFLFAFFDQEKRPENVENSFQKLCTQIASDQFVQNISNKTNNTEEEYEIMILLARNELEDLSNNKVIQTKIDNIQQMNVYEMSRKYLRGDLHFT